MIASRIDRSNANWRCDDEEIYCETRVACARRMPRSVLDSSARGSNDSSGKVERNGMYADSWRRQMTVVEREMQAAAG